MFSLCQLLEKFRIKCAEVNVIGMDENANNCEPCSATKAEFSRLVKLFRAPNGQQKSERSKCFITDEELVKVQDKVMRIDSGNFSKL